MKLKNVLCIAALSAAIALAGVPQNMATLVHAEETQITNLDEILRQMYALYQNGDYAAMLTLDISAGDYAEMVKNSGSDRYVVDLDGNTKAMMYIADGGYWWYFGQMENNLRQGYGTTFAFNSEENYDVFTGNYTADSPNGNGTYSSRWYSGEYSGEGYAISGNFQGAYLNGTYQVNVNWINRMGILDSSSLPITYENNCFKSLDTNTIYFDHIDPAYTDDNGNYCNDYVFYDHEYANYAQDMAVSIDYELIAVGFSDIDYTKFVIPKESLNSGLLILKGDADVSTITSAPSETQASDTETILPVPTATPAAAANTYVVAPNDNLSKIAVRVYGDAKYWRIIYDANSNVIKSNYVIYTNQVLTMPTL